jgi:hypothetical protein
VIDPVAGASVGTAKVEQDHASDPGKRVWRTTAGLIDEIHSALGLANGLIDTRPFRAPHHTISSAALIGGGSTPRPGEISLAHNGVLVLDELPEFARAAVEGLRQPLEERTVTIDRIQGALRLPASFLLIAAANPCPCGWRDSGVRECTCGPGALERYRQVNAASIGAAFGGDGLEVALAESFDDGAESIGAAFEVRHRDQQLVLALGASSQVSAAPAQHSGQLHPALTARHLWIWSRHFCRAASSFAVFRHASAASRFTWYVL